MIKLIKSFFSQDKPVDPVSLESPLQLKKGDNFELRDSLNLPVELSGNSFEVKKVSTYFYTDTPTPELTIKDGGNCPLYLTIDPGADDELLLISRQLKRKEIESIFGYSLIKSLTKNKAIENVDAQKFSDEFKPWLGDAKYFRKVFAGKGRYFEKDLRDSEQPSSGGEDLKYYEFHSEDEKYFLEIEVWDADEIEVCIGLTLPFSDITDYWKSN